MMHNFSSLEKGLNVVLPKFISKQKGEKKFQNSLQEDTLGCNEPFSVIYQQSLLIRKVPIDWKSASVMSSTRRARRRFGELQASQPDLGAKAGHGADLLGTIMEHVQNNQGIRPSSITKGIVQHYYRLPRKVLESPSLEGFKSV